MFVLLFGVFMKSFFENWPAGFVKRLEILRALDERGVRRKLYIDRTDEVFDAMSADVRDAIAAELPGIDPRGLDIHQLYRYYKRGQSGNQLADLLIARIRPECEKIYVSPRVYGVSYIFFALFAARGEDEDARDFFNQFMRPLVIAYRFKQLARWLGRRGGGRPSHRLKDEALKLADEFLAENPAAPQSRCAQYISGIFVTKYADPPSVSTIRNWLSEFYRNDK